MGSYKHATLCLECKFRTSNLMLKSEEAARLQSPSEIDSEQHHQKCRNEWWTDLCREDIWNNDISWSVKDCISKSLPYHHPVSNRFQGSVWVTAHRSLQQLREAFCNEFATTVLQNQSFVIVPPNVLSFARPEVKPHNQIRHPCWSRQLFPLALLVSMAHCCSPSVLGSTLVVTY